MVHEIRTTGVDTNSGAVDSATVVTDYSQQNAAQYTLNGTTVTMHTAGVTNVMILTGIIPAAGDVGNTVRIASGTGFIPGLYVITAQGGGTWTLDRNATSGVASGAPALLDDGDQQR
jgi:hypothetical protein